MKFEIRRYYSRGYNYCAILDKEISVPCREITEEEAKQYMGFLESAGLRRHETKTQIFFDKKVDSAHSEEYIFYK